MFAPRALPTTWLRWLALTLYCVGLIFGFTACEGQQNANKAAFASVESQITLDEKYSKVFDHMEYEREYIRVYVKPGPDTLPEDKGAVVQHIAQLMGDALKADPKSKLKELIVFGNIEEEELWKFRYDMKDGKVYTEKARLTTTM